MKAVIIENEKAAAKLLTTIVEQYCTDISVVGEAATIADGLQLISSSQPDLVFLDIELDDGQSFDLLDMLERRPFKIIFTTAYDEYALKAFRYDAVDYILKPYGPKSVVAAVQRVQERQQTSQVLRKLNAIIDSRPAEPRITLGTSAGTRLCLVKNIQRIEAASSYCTVHLADGDKVIVSKPLGDVERQLPTKAFYRVHSGHSVNISHVKQIVNKDGGYVELKDGTQVPLARRRKQEFIEKLNT